MNSLKKQYFPHFHPVIIFLYFCLILTIIMFSVNPIIRLMALIAGVFTQWRLVEKQQIKSDLKLFAIILIFSMLGNFLFVHTGRTILFEWVISASKSYRFTWESLFYGISFGVMMCAIFIWFRLFSLCFDSEKILYLFGKRLPKVSLVLSMILRFIPLYQKEVDNIKLAQKGIGLNNEVEGRKKIEKEYQTFLSLFGWALEKSIITSDSMNSRGYGLKNRTQYQAYHIKRRDITLVLVSAILFSGVYLCSKSGGFSFYYYPRINLGIEEGVSLLGYISLGFLLCLPLLVELKEQVKWTYLEWKM